MRVFKEFHEVCLLENFLGSYHSRGGFEDSNVFKVCDIEIGLSNPILSNQDFICPRLLNSATGKGNEGNGCEKCARKKNKTWPFDELSDFSPL